VTTVHPPAPPAAASTARTGAFICIAPTGNLNESLVGLTPALAHQLGVKIPAGVSIPSIDAKVAACDAIPTGDARQSCWIALDKYVMESVVPWVPYLTQHDIHLLGSDVTAWDYDQSSNTTAYSHVAVAANKQG
jgi:hypothetical protein